MGLEDVKKEILDSAKAEAKKILSEADKEKKEIQEAAQVKIDAISDRLEKETKEAIEQYTVMSNAETGSIVKKQRLVLEKELIDEVFSSVVTKFSAKDREKHIKSLIKNSKKIGFDKIYSSKADAKIANAQVMNEIDGGIILENKEGNVRVDLSYNALLWQIKDENLAEVAKILF